MLVCENSWIIEMHGATIKVIEGKSLQENAVWWILCYNGLVVFISKIHNTINILSVLMPLDLRENIHTWMKVSLVILVLVQITGTEKVSLIGLFFLILKTCADRP
jgi:hypothetical protein